MFLVYVVLVGFNLFFGFIGGDVNWFGLLGVVFFDYMIDFW